MTDHLTDKEIAEIKAREEAATEGPWSHEGSGNVYTGSILAISSCGGEYGCHETLPQDDAHFIAHARTDIPRLLDEVERLRDELDDATMFQGEIESYRIALESIYAEVRDIANGDIKPRDGLRWIAERVSDELGMMDISWKEGE